jgi:hypothetical protein
MRRDIACVHITIYYTRELAFAPRSYTAVCLPLPLPEKPTIDSPQQHLQPASCSLLVARNTVCRGLPPLHTAR